VNKERFVLLHAGRPLFNPADIGPCWTTAQHPGELRKPLLRPNGIDFDAAVLEIAGVARQAQRLSRFLRKIAESNALHAPVDPPAASDARLRGHSEESIAWHRAAIVQQRGLRARRHVEAPFDFENSRLQDVDALSKEILPGLGILELDLETFDVSVEALENFCLRVADSFFQIVAKLLKVRAKFRAELLKVRAKLGAKLLCEVLQVALGGRTVESVVVHVLLLDYSSNGLAHCFQNEIWAQALQPSGSG